MKGLTRNVVSGVTSMMLAHGVCAQDMVVKIGHVAPLSGFNAYWGKESEIGARVAIEELNAARPRIGGANVKFELLSEDDASDPKQGVGAAQKLIDARVNGVVGPLWSGVALPMAKILSDAQIPQISPWVTHPDFTRVRPRTTFRVVADDYRLGQVLAEYVVRVLQLKKVVVVDDQTAHGKASASEFEKALKSAGGAVLRRGSVSSQSPDFSSILSDIRSQSPDAVFFDGDDVQAGNLVRQLAQTGSKAKVIGGRRTCAPGRDGAVSGPIADRQLYCGQSTVPGMESPRSYSYDAVKLLADAMVRARSADPRIYLSALASTRNFRGATGFISFDDSGNRIDAPVTVFTVEKGRLVFAGSSAGATGTGGGCPDCPSTEVCCSENSKKVCKAKCS